MSNYVESNILGILLHVKFTHMADMFNNINFSEVAEYYIYP